jgi:SSS family solute:Na+ symporter
MTRAHFAIADIALLAAYFGFTLMVGFWKRKRTTEDYLIASRALSLPVFVATLVATWYGGILAVGEFTYDAGLANWTTQGLPYYIFAVLFAVILAPRVRQAGLYTIPDKLAAEYDRKTALLGAACAFVLITPAPYIRMVGQLVSVSFGWDILPAMLVGTLFSVVYVYAGGFQSDVRINVFQFCLMFAGFALALPILAARLGGYHWLAAHLPKEHLRLDGGQDIGFILVWFFIALWTFVDPGFHQRCYAARTPSTARCGILIAVLCWAAFDFLTTTTGLYARAAMPDLPSGTHELAFPLLAERILPPGVKGLFYIAMLATVMSTVVSYTFMAAMTLGRDFIWRLRGEKDNARVPRYTQAGLLLATGFGIVISLLIPSVVRQWYALGTVVVPGLLLPVVTGYLPRWKIRPTFAFYTMLAGIAVSLACLLSGWVRFDAPLGWHLDVYADTAQFPFHMQPMYPGLLASAAVYALGRTVQSLKPPKPGTFSIDN